MQSRERKKMYVKELEMKSMYLESECRRLDYTLRCCMAENFALNQRLQKNDALAAKQESAVLFVGKTLKTHIAASASTSYSILVYFDGREMLLLVYSRSLAFCFISSFLPKIV